MMWVAGFSALLSAISPAADRIEWSCGGCLIACVITVRCATNSVKPFRAIVADVIDTACIYSLTWCVSIYFKVTSDEARALQIAIGGMLIVIDLIVSVLVGGRNGCRPRRRHIQSDTDLRSSPPPSSQTVSETVSGSKRKVADCM